MTFDRFFFDRSGVNDCLADNRVLTLNDIDMQRSAQEVSDKPFTVAFTLSFRLFNHDYPVLIYLSLLLFNFEWANYSNNVDIRVNKKTLRELFRNLNIIKMHYFKNIQNVFCILLLCFTVNAQEWPIGRVSDGKVAMKISDCFLSLQEWQCPVRGKIWSSSKGKLWKLKKNQGHWPDKIHFMPQSHRIFLTIIFLSQLLLKNIAEK